MNQVPENSDTSSSGSPKNTSTTPAGAAPAAVTPNLPPVDGLRAWGVCFGVFCAGFVSLGWTYAQGIFVIPLQQEFDASLTQISLIATMNFVFFFAGGVLSGPLSAKYGVKRLIVFGSAMWVTGMFLGSASHTAWESILTQGVMTGIGSSALYWPSLAVTPTWFNKYRATAMGAAVLGSSIGLLAMSLGGQQLLQSFGWRTTLQIFGGVGAGLLLVAIALIDRRTPPLRSQGLFTVTWVLLKLPSFQLFITAVFFFQFCFFIPYLYIAPVGCLYLVSIWRSN